MSEIKERKKEMKERREGKKRSTGPEVEVEEEEEP